MFLGVAIGGFFALAGATVVRLVSLQGMGKGMATIFFGISAATVAAPPLGALIGETFGWRAAFVAAAGLGLLALVIQAFCLPSVKRSFFSEGSCCRSVTHDLAQAIQSAFVR